MKVRFTLLLLLLNVGISYAQTIRYVKPTTSGNGSGTSWANASADFQGMINASSANDQVWVAKGTYKPTTSSDRSISFSMKNGVGIYGGFAGTETQLSQRNWVTNETILSGEIGDQASIFDNSYHVIFNNDNGLTNSSVLNGFTITSAFGASAGTNFENYGSGMLNIISATPYITNCIFKEHSGATFGGGIINTNNAVGISTSTTIITNCLFLNNANKTPDTQYSGGILTFYGANTTVTNCTFSGNWSGVFLGQQGPQQNVKNCIFGENLFSIYDLSNNVSVTNSLISGRTGSGNIDKNPLFINANNGDFRLQACSPAINAGNNTGISGVDLANNPRIYNNGIVDMGAYEFQGTAITAPTSVSISSTTACQGTSVNLQATCSNGTVNWYNASTGGTALGTGSPFSYTAPMGANQTFYASCKGTCESALVATTSTLTVTNAPARLYVNASATGSNTGLTWADAFTDLQSALNYNCSANLGEIWVAKGTYKPTSGTNRTVSFSMMNGVGIYGGFAGTETQLSQRNWVSNRTILSGDLLSNDGQNFINTTENSYHVLRNMDVNNTARLDGFTISGGNANGSIDNGNPYTSSNERTGGGIFNINASPIINNCRIINNQAANFGGGGLSLYGISSPTIINSIFWSNPSSFNHCVLARETSQPTFVNCTIVGNDIVVTDQRVSISIKNSIVWGSKLINNYSATFKVSYSIVQGGYAGLGNLNSNPLFTDESSGNLTIQSCSPAINSGDNTDISGEDLANNPRIYNNGVVDMGAYEFQGAAITAPTAISISSTTACQGISVNLLATCSNGTVTWYNASTGGTALGTGSPFSYTATVGANQRFYASCKGACESALVATTNTLTVTNAPARLYVNASATGSNTGLTWADAFTDLQSALNYNCPANLSEIWVAKGTYKPTSGTNRTVSFSMMNGVGIYGGFAGSETQLSQRNWGTNATVLSGDIGNIGDMSDNSFNVIRNDNNGLTGTAIVDGFTITNGNANGDSQPTGYGGGMYNKVSKPTIRNCIFAKNQCNVSGGGIYNLNANEINPNTPQIISNCVFIGNYSYQTGGAIFNSYSSPNITNCTISGNFSDSFAIVNINMSGSSPTITNCIIWGNSGGIYNNVNTSVSYSIVQGGYSGTGNLNIDPIFVTQPTIGLGVTGDLRLQTCSPALNVGDNTANTNTTDLAGNSRIFNTTIDMGAYELQTAPLSLSIVTPLADSYCKNSPAITLEGSPSGGRFALNVSANVITRLDPSSLNAGSYNILYDYSVGNCFREISKTVTIQALPTPNVTVNSNLCVGSTLNFNSVAGMSAYSWTGPNSFSSTLQNPSINSVSTLATGTYQVTVTDANGCTAIATTSVTVNALPTATASSNSPVCAGTPLNLSSSGGTSYAWTGVNSFSSTLQNPTINTAPTLATGTYQVLVTNDVGCTAIATTSVTVNALPTATASSNTPICAGTTLNLSASGGVSYTWTGVNSFSSTLQNPSISSATNLATGTYQVVVTNDAGCTAIATTSVTVNALPTATASSNTPICAGTTLNLSSSGGVSYTWTGVNSFSSTLQNPTINTAPTLATGTYQVVLTNDAGCTAIATTSVTVNALPTATASSNTPICAGTTLNLSSSGGVSYTWTGVNSFSSTLQNPTINTAPTLATGTYQVLVTNDVGCTAVATTSVTVNALPTATASSNSPVCAGTTLSLSASGGTSYAWTGTNSFSSTLQNPSISSATNLATGTYQVVVTNDAGCSAIATTSVTVNALPTATASSNTPICAGTTLNLSASGGVSYTWTGVNSFSSTLQNPTINTAPTLATGTYQVVVTNDAGCTAIATTSVMVNTLPTATASINSPICSGTMLSLSATGGTSYAWTGVNSFSSTLQNPTINTAPTLATGTYQVLVTNENGCIAVATTSVIVNALPTATASSNSAICSGTTLNLSASGGVSYTWTGVNSFSSTLQNPTINTAPTLATGTYQVLVTNDVGCTAIATTSVTVNALPTATASSNSPVCAGTPLNLSSSGGTSYAWTGVNSFSSTLQNPTINTALTLATGTYQVLVTNDVGCTAIATISAIVNPVPITPTTQANTQIIFGGSVTLTVTGCSNENDVLKWYQSTNNVLVTMPVSPTVTSNYYATCETTLNGITCISPQSADVTVTVLSPTPPVATGGTTCISTPLSLTSTGCSGSTGTFVLKWYQNSDNTLVTMPVSPNVTTDYYAKCEQTFNSITAVSDKSNVVSLTVLNPAIPVASGTTMYNGNSTTLSSTGCTGEGFVVKWYETATNNLVTMPVSPIVTTQYYAKCEQTANSVTCISAKSNDVTLKVVNRIFVDITKASAPIQNGNSWATAFGNLQTGLAAATASVEVWVAKGTYKTTTTLDRTISFNIPNNVIVYGGFAGTENALNERNFRTNVSILSGEIGNQSILTDNSYHVVVFNGSSSNTRLDGFNITGGNANFDPKRVGALPAMTPTSSNIETGGGILVQNGASPVITNCSVVNNSAVFGGGIYATDASLPQLLACKFMSNEATFGSGVYFQNGSHATINNTLISGNRGMGGLYNNNSNPTITNTTLSGNGGYNGGIFNSNSQPVVKNSIIWGNSTPFNDTQSVITNSIIQGGYAGTGNLNYDPQFVNQAPEGLSPNLNGDYHLKASSLGIDRGDNGSISTTDLDLDSSLRRYNGGRVDLGAYEFQGNGTSSVVISIASGNWESNSTWDINRVPQIGDIVIIDQNHLVTINSQGNAKNIEYRGTGQLKFNSTNSKLNIGF